MEETTNVPVSTPVKEYAGFWLRLLAYLIDYLLLSFVLGIVFVILGLALGIGVESLNEIEDTAVQWMVITYVIFVSMGAVIVIWLYFALMESGKNQGTLGKMLLHIKVTDLEGEQISFARATGRFFCKFLSSSILYIGYIMIGFTEKQQGLHDMITGCLVVKT